MSWRESETVSNPEVQGLGSVLDTESGEWVTVTQAAELAAVTERTVRKWIAEGTVESRLLPNGNRDIRLVRRSSLPLPGLWGSRMDPETGQGATGTDREPGSDGSGNPTEPGQGVSLTSVAGLAPCSAAGDTDAGAAPFLKEREPGQGSSRNDREVIGGRDTVAELQARLDGAHLAAKLHALRVNEARRLLEEERRRYERERGELTTELAFMRQQLAARSDAERELRVLLAHTTQTMQALSERPALVAPVGAAASLTPSNLPGTSNHVS